MTKRLVTAGLISIGFCLGQTRTEAAVITSSGNYNFSFIHNGSTRTYVAHAPAFYSTQTPTALVIVLHGGGGTALGMKKQALMDAASDKDGFLAVYPQGTGPVVWGATIGTWNAGLCCGDAMTNNVDDVGFISKMIDRMAADFALDRKRVYATGISNGAQMSYRLACELSDKIAAIAPVAGQGVFANCAPQRPVPVMHFHGTADPCASYSSGTCGGCSAEYYKIVLGITIDPYYFPCEPVPDYIQRWKTMNKAQDPPQVIFQNGAATCVSYSSSSVRAVTLCTIQDGGHTWPGGSYGEPCEGDPTALKCTAYKNIVGTISNDIIANDAMWAFFSQHKLDIVSPTTPKKLRQKQ